MKFNISKSNHRHLRLRLRLNLPSYRYQSVLPEEEQSRDILQASSSGAIISLELTELAHLLVDLEDPAPDVGRVRVRLVLHREHLAVLLRALLLRPEGGEGLEI